MQKVLLLVGSVLIITAGCSKGGDPSGEKPKKAQFKTHAEAEAAAPEFGCTGAHQMGEMWMVCESTSKLVIRGTTNSLAQWATPKRRAHEEEVQALGANVAEGDGLGP